MNARHLLTTPLVAAALAGPYLAMEDEWRRPLTDAFGVASTSDASLPRSDAVVWEPPAPVVEGPLLEPPVLGGETASRLASLAVAPPVSDESAVPGFDASRAQFSGAPVTEFSEVLRFDVTPEWMFTRWSRVTTITADQSLKGFRAPLVTGTRVDDIAGVVTYYFGRSGSLQRVGFEGTTGDTRRLVAFLTQQYAFKAEPNLGAGMYLVRWNAKPMSALRVDYAPVVRADMPHGRYTLKLEINRADAGYEMSEEFRQILGTDQETQRWLPF